MNTQTVTHMGGRSLKAVKNRVWVAMTDARVMARLDRLAGADRWECSCGSAAGVGTTEGERTCLTLQALQAAAVWMVRNPGDAIDRCGRDGRKDR